MFSNVLFQKGISNCSRDHSRGCSRFVLEKGAHDLFSKMCGMVKNYQKLEILFFKFKNKYKETIVEKPRFGV
jgi:hypothetical protein